jgi:hypothetical protein
VRQAERQGKQKGKARQGKARKWGSKARKWGRQGKTLNLKKA